MPLVKDFKSVIYALKNKFISPPIDVGEVHGVNSRGGEVEMRIHTSLFWGTSFPTFCLETARGAEAQHNETGFSPGTF